MMRFLRLLFVVLVPLGLAWLFVSGPSGCDGGDVPPPPPASVEAAGTTHALLVACTEYPTLRAGMSESLYENTVRLVGPANDATLMHDVLTKYLGVPDENITVLAGWPDDEAKRPTRANILHHLDRLAGDAPDGGRVFFFFAGHGAQQPDYSDDEADGFDELIMPADVGEWETETKSIRNCIDDDELRTRLHAMRDRGLTVWALFDCCHSGTLTRSPNPMAMGPVKIEPKRLRSLQMDDLGVPDDEQHIARQRTRSLQAGQDPQPDELFVERDQQSSRGSLVAMYAAQSWQQAPEMDLPRGGILRSSRDHGLCTFYVALALQRYGGALTIAELLSHVRTAYDRLPYTDAIPMAEGDLSVRVLPGADLASTPVLLQWNGEYLVAEAGEIRGLTPGSELEVFKPGTFREPSGRLGRVRIQEVRATQALCMAIADDVALDTIPAGAPAQLVYLANGPHAVLVHAKNTEGEALSAEQIERIRRESGLTEESAVNVAFVPEARAQWDLMYVDSDPLPDLYLLDSREDGVPPIRVQLGGLRPALERVHRASHLRRMARGQRLGGLPQGLEVSLAIRRGGEGDPVDFEDGMTLAPGDAWTLRITNETNKEVDVAVRHIGPDQQESHVWPEEESSRRFTRRETDLHEEEFELDASMFGPESLIVVAAIRDVDDPPLEVGALAVARKSEPPPTRGDLDDDDFDGVMGSAPPDRLVGVREFRWRRSWGRFGVPTAMLEDMTTFDAPVTTPEYASPHATAQTWTSGKIVRGDEATPDVLLLQGTLQSGGGVFGIFVDADGEAGLDTTPLLELAQKAAARRLPVDSAFFLGTTGSLACYPRHLGDMSLGLIFEAEPNQDRAVWDWIRLDGGQWLARPGSAAWLSQEHLPGKDARPDHASLVARAWRLFRRP